MLELFEPIQYKNWTYIHLQKNPKTEAGIPSNTVYMIHDQNRD